MAADGIDQFFGIPDALPETRWWIKQGWGTSRGRRIINTTGVVGKDHGHILVMLTSHPIAVRFRVVARAATSGTAAIRDQWTELSSDLRGPMTRVCRRRALR